MKKLVAMLMIIFSLFCSSTVVSSAAVDPAVVLVNPVSLSTVYSNNLLISVKITQPKTIKVKVFVERQMVNGTLSAINVDTLTISNGTINSETFQSTLISDPPAYKSDNNLSFYTKQINDLTPGLYRIQIDTLDAAGEKIYTSKSYVEVKEKTAEADAKIFDKPQSGTMQFLQNLLNTIFGD